MSCAARLAVLGLALVIAAAGVACGGGGGEGADLAQVGDPLPGDGDGDGTNTSEDGADETALSDADGEGEDAATAEVGDAAPRPQVEQSRYEADLGFIAKPRLPPSPHWQAVQDLCAQRFEALGLEVLRQDYGSGVNVIGALPGTSRADELVVVGAHYDTTANCPGADDNGSGVAGVLEVARVLSAQPHERTLVAVCWDEEEFGLKGSRAFALQQQATGTEIVVVYDLEMIGYRDTTPGSQLVPDGMELLFPSQVAELNANGNRGDFIALVVDDQPVGVAAATHIGEAATAIGLPSMILPVPASLKNSEAVGVLRRSDHATFWFLDVPAILITDTANLRYGGYHCADFDDVPERLDHAFSADVIRATLASMRRMLNAAAAEP